MIERLLAMLTVLNWCAIACFLYLSSEVQDVVRGLSLLILAAVVSVWFSGRLFEFYIKLFDSLTSVAASDSTKIAVAAVADLVLHLGPLLLLGLPHQLKSIWMAYGVMLVWYLVVRDSIEWIYVPGIPADRAILVATGLAAASTAAATAITATAITVAS